MNRKSTFSVTDTALLAAFCMFLSLIEYMIPKPMPFMRIGLAHLPVLLSLVIMPVRGTLLLTLLKVLGQGLVNGSLFSYIFIFSAAGSFTSTLVMIIVFRAVGRFTTLTGVSVAGAFSSNIVQIILARQFIFGEAAVLIAPPFLAVGIVSSVVLGLFAENFRIKSDWIKGRREASMQETAGTAAGGYPAKERKTARFAFLCGLLSVPAFVFQPDYRLRIAAAAAFIILSAVSGKRFRILPNLLTAAGIIAANLITPFGRILLTVGPFTVTGGALVSGADKAALIIGLIYISRTAVRRGLKFPGRIGSILSLVFYYFEQLTEGERIRRGNIIGQLDDRLNRLSAGAEPAAGGVPEAEVKHSGTSGYTAGLLSFVTAWGLFVLNLALN